MQNIRDHYDSGLAEVLAANHFQKFRMNQIYNALEERGIRDFDRIHHLPVDLKKILRETYIIQYLRLAGEETAKDGTRKALFRLPDGDCIETVMIPHADRLTCCVSTQAGCALKCAFCATGAGGFRRNLTWWEIADQVKEFCKPQPTNIVFMGMGEPLLNMDNVLKAAVFFNDPRGMNISHQKITISTAGIIEGIDFLAEIKKYKLAVSLHSPFQKIRQELMPVAAKYPLDRLFKALIRYSQKTGHAVTLEYALLGKDINMSQKDADALKKWLHRFPSKLNLIRYNPSMKNSAFKRPEENDVLKFLNYLKEEKNVFMRDSRGSDIQAACGQLVLREG